MKIYKIPGENSIAIENLKYGGIYLHKKQQNDVTYKVLKILLKHRVEQFMEREVGDYVWERLQNN